MMTWLFRAALVVGCPLLVYTQINHSPRGFLLGLLVGAVLVGIEAVLEAVKLSTFIFGIVGATAGFFISKSSEFALVQIGNDNWLQLWDRYAILRHFAFAILGAALTIRKLPELDTLDKDILAMGKRRGAELKVLDTSAIIDGRIIDICETRFLSGTLVVPRFVLNELHHLSDSPDTLKRARGRRGLDVLARLQENTELSVRILDRDFDEDDVDAKVVLLAKELGGKVLTTDFNLNKVAAVEGIHCLNVNDLATALKPVILPGEVMTLFVMKEGKEREQGVGYLDDGTMVVVEEGKRHIGKRIDVSVSSILQTSAGRMIFGKAKGERQPHEEHRA